MMALSLSCTVVLPVRGFSFANNVVKQYIDSSALIHTILL